MKDNDLIFPKVNKALTDFLNDEDGNISRKRLVSIGSFILLMSIINFDTVFAHRSHASHTSHSSHSSTSYIRDHTNHSSHSDHGSHSSHNSHTSHSNTTSHSNSAYSTEGDVEYAPSISEIPEYSISPIENGSVIDLSTAPLAVDASEANSTLLNMDLPIPDTNSVDAMKSTGLEFNSSLIDKGIVVGSTLAGSAAIIAGGAGTIHIIKDKKAAAKSKAAASSYLSEFNENSIEHKIEELKGASDLDTTKTFLKDLADESVLNDKKLDIIQCIENIGDLQKAIDNNPNQKELIDRFTSYFIPETIGILLTYVQYIKDNAPQKSQDVIYKKSKESLRALNEALQEKIQNIYQYSTMETVAKAEALNKILEQNGYTKEKINEKEGKN